MDDYTSQQELIQNFPDDIVDLPRRNFIKRVLSGAGAVAVMPAFSFAEGRDLFDRLKENAARLSKQEVGDEAFWKLVQAQFMIREELIMLNAANLCPSPYPVQQYVFQLTRDIDTDPSFNNRGKFSGLREETRQKLAKYLGADPGEIAITRNTSEGNNIVIGGMTFKPGDEVVVWDENHPTANVAWDVRAERYGFKVIRVKVPALIDNAEQLISPFRKALTNRTKVICFSHVSNMSGIALPAKELCAMARERNVLSHIDGAQTFGSFALNLSDLGCDFYTGSSHKWFVGPKEVGVLFVRKDRIPDLWPSIIGVGYPDSLEKGAVKFETLGQRDDARIAAMGKTVDFHNSIGKARIEQRIRHMVESLKIKLSKKNPDIIFYTPFKSDLSGGVVVFKPPGVDFGTAMNRLYNEHNIGCAVFGGDKPGIRMCPHIYNTMDQIDKAVNAVVSLI